MSSININYISIFRYRTDEQPDGSDLQKVNLNKSELIQKNINKSQANTIRKHTAIPMVPGIEHDLIVRFSEIEILPEFLEEYNANFKTEAAASIKVEPGVIAIFPMYQKENPTQIRIVEMYATKMSVNPI